MDVHAIRAQNNDKHVRLAGNANDAMTAAAAGPLAEGQGHGGVKGHPQTEMKERDERERERTITHTHTHTHTQVVPGGGGLLRLRPLRGGKAKRAGRPRN